MEIKAMCCNIISAMVCYMNGEFTREMLIKDIKHTTHDDKDIIEHLETILYLLIFNPKQSY